MSKRSTKKKPAPKARSKAPARAPAKPKTAPKSLGAQAAGPRSQTLPGMSKVRSGRLDNLCESIGECRDHMNTARQEETGLVQAALQTMVQKKLTVYKHGGVELARVPGAEKLRVRVTKETGDAGDGDLETPEDDGNGEGEHEGEGQGEADTTAGPSEIRAGVPDDLGASEGQ